MARIEDYGLIGDLQTAALVGRDGSIDWACFPRFDSGACFAALLGTTDHGRWLIAPRSDAWSPGRRYRENTLVLETEWETDGGKARVIDFMPPRGKAPDIVRIVEGLAGEVEFDSELVIRYDYGSTLPWVRRMDDDTRVAVAGPDGLCFRSAVEHRGENMRTIGEFTVREGERVPFTLTWYPSNEELPERIDAEQALQDTVDYWTSWVGACEYDGTWKQAVHESLIVLKALTYAPTGGIVAAPTTSLPEKIGGERNWDYRFCWLRDATLVLLAFINAGYLEEAHAWRTWLLRAAAGDPAALQIMYGVGGERRLTEMTLDWLPGYEGSRPVRAGNAASEQFQLDVFGEVLDAMHQGRVHELERSPEAWSLQRRLLGFLEHAWKEPDDGIWEVRGGRRHFTHSKVMAWVAFDRGVKAVEEFGRAGPVERWRKVRDEIHREVCERGFDHELNSFTQSYGSKRLDASLLVIPLVGFLPADDGAVLGTVAAIERELYRDGFVYRYAGDDEHAQVDGLPAGEGAFLPCTFWLADNFALQGRLDEAEELFERLLSTRSDLGLLAEEWDPASRRQLGNFPQAFTHVALVNSAFNLDRQHEATPEQRAQPSGY
ncbi:MAG: glucoamylase [Actinobacteria bacterium 13_1_20CM_4_69_9]|jgi:GH15 family glucan-1,4-alpha-glucosidase|nr:MAG: glucoamylase [Actinobacteria bacterium 13_1_20CM_4_69_9]